MADDVLAFDPAGLDTWTEPSAFEVTAERIAEYAAATNDPIEAHRAGRVASPVFAIVPVFRSLAEPVLAVVPPPLIGKVVHGEQDFVFHRPIRPGETLMSSARMTGWSGRDNGTAVCVRLRTTTEAGDPVNDQYVTSFVRGFNAGGPVGTLAPGHRLDESVRADEPVAVVRQHVDDDQTFRYGPAAGDPMPIHLDEEFARRVGLPGIIAHGMCTMAFTSWALLTELADGDVSRLRRLAVRFARPVLPGQDLTTTIWRSRARGTETFAFETTVGDTVVLKDGLAELAG